MPSSVRASIRPSVNRPATEPGTSGTVVWRRPVRTPTPIGGDEPAVTGSWGSRPDDDRRRVPGARVGERARLRIVHGQQHGGEVSAEVVVDHAAGDLERDARLEPGLEVGAQRVAHEGGAGERAAAVAGHVAEDEADAAAGERQHVVEVAARAGAVGRPVGDRGAQRADLLGHRRQQRGLEQADLLEQLAPLAGQPARAQRGQQVADAEQHRQRGQRRQRGLERVGHDLDETVDGLDHGPLDDVRLVASVDWPCPPPVSPLPPEP